MYSFDEMENEDLFWGIISNSNSSNSHRIEKKQEIFVKMFEQDEMQEINCDYFDEIATDPNYENIPKKKINRIINGQSLFKHQKQMITKMIDA